MDANEYITKAEEMIFGISQKRKTSEFTHMSEVIKEVRQKIEDSKNKVVNREQIAERIWGYDNDSQYNNVEVYVSFLRKKIKFLESNVRIKAIRGIGYMLEEIHD